MMPDRFTIVQLNIAADHGLVRQTRSTNGIPLSQLLSFTPSRVAEAFRDPEDGSYGIRIPGQAVANRVPSVGDELAGVIAADVPNVMATDLDGNHFLRNWVYLSQLEEVENIVEDGDLPDQDDQDDLKDDRYSNYDIPDDECPGNCGQPAYACTCDELASYRAFHANPATRGSFWTA